MSLYFARFAEVREEHLRAGLALWQYCEDSARHIFGRATGDTVADRILEALRTNSEGMTKPNTESTSKGT